VWRPGSKLFHPFNPELGVGVVRHVDGRHLQVWFPDAEQELTLTAEGGVVQRLVLRPGGRVRVLETDEVAVVAESLEDGYRLVDGRLLDEADVWPLTPPDTPLERLAAGRVGALDDFRNRLDALRLASLREAGGLGSFLGGRIELFAHQLHTAVEASRRDPVRWLLADEVGLGKTVEACLILSALVRTGRAERVLVVAPGTLVIQWLGELYRKFHQVFVLLDRERLESVATTIGEDANPFEVHPHGVMELETLAGDPELLAAAAEAPPDLIVLDEAHRLATREQHEALAPLVTQAKHALLLTATPLSADREGFHRLLSLLDPDAFPSYADFVASLERGEAVVPCTSAVRRADVGGLPPRVPSPVDLPAAADPLRRDPRARWIAERVRAWSRAGEKALVFVHELETLRALKEFLESETTTRMACFHEEMSVAARDIEVASFRDTGLPVLLSSDAGSEGRNFQFCDRLVLWDLPRDPVVLEQRIGRLDRIGRRTPVEIVYFRLAGATPDVARLYERLDLFGRPAAGLDLALAEVTRALAAGGDAPLDEDGLVVALADARKQAGAEIARVFYRDGFDPERDAAVLDRVPEELETLTRAVCVGACEGLNFEVVEKGGAALYYLELGASATVDSLPGVAGGARYLGTFDRAEAVRKDELDFFASGHPLVEGLLLELEDGPRGRAALVEVEAPFGPAAGLLVLSREDGALRADVIDADGALRPEWREPLLAALPAAADLARSARDLGTAFGDAVRALAEALPEGLAPEAVAFFRARPVA
jgi:ATP-dependent helicase HepA